MKRKSCVIWLLAILCTVCLTVLTNVQGGEGEFVTTAQLCTEHTVISTQSRQHREATLSDASQLYRICSSRPQRIVQTNGSRNERTVTPWFGFSRQLHVKSINSFFDSRCRLEISPFCLSASRDYYVIALRHIIC